jgi:RNA polymerase sigma-70 factor (ECF subfamily)
MNEPTLEQLVQSAREGDREAADAIARRYMGRLRPIVRRQIGDHLRARVDTDDMVQTAIHQAVRDLEGFEYQGEKAFEGWLARVAARKVQMAARHHQAGKRDVRRDDIETRFGEKAGRLTSPTQGAARNEVTKDIREAVAQLPDRERSVVELHTFDGLTFGEVAEKLGLENKDRARYVFQSALKLLGDELESHA